MHELFLTALVKGDDFQMACAVLQGYTWMSARKTYHRVLFFAGDPHPRGLPNLRHYRDPASQRSLALWQELSKQLGRSSYVLQLAYEVHPESDFGKASPADFNAAAGTLRWADVPDPLRDTPITQRKKLDIPDQKNLAATMSDNNHKYKNEMIQESYSFVKTNIEFVFTRYYHLPDSPGKPVAVMPAWNDLRPVDSAQKWTLQIKLNVAEDNQPDKLHKAHEELMAIKAELDKLFEFKPLDRRVFDTRIAPPPMVAGRLAA